MVATVALKGNKTQAELVQSSMCIHQIPYPDDSTAGIFIGSV